MSKRRSRTAEELMAELAKDAEFSKQQRNRDELFRGRQEELKAAETRVVDDLRDAGVSLSSIWDIVNGKAALNDQAARVLFQHLNGNYPDRVREGIARALIGPEARLGWETLKEVFESDTDRDGLGSKFAIGCALAAAAAADRVLISHVARLALERRHGRNRLAFIDVLSRSSDPIARDALIELALDPDTAREVKRVAKNKGRRDRR